MMVENRNRMTSLRRRPGTRVGQATGTRATMKVGMANTTEKIKVSFQLRIVRL